MSSIDAEIVINKEKITYKSTVGNIVQENTKELNSFFESLSSLSFFDTGILPLDGSGTLMIRQAMGHTQVVFQHAPGVYRVIWGETEGSSEAVHYDLAMPYRIVIGDFVDNEFYGARHFYSVVPITNDNQILYHVNLPNLNCKGYGSGNGVGWICLYHNQPSIAHLPLGGKVNHLIERAGGTEAYNDANMSQTDGPRFYHEKYSEALDDYPESERELFLDNVSYLWDPDSWEYKSKDNNFSWTLDPDLWIPVKVYGMDNQTAHCNDDEAVFYTFGMAVDGSYRAYYGDPHVPKHYQKFVRPDLEIPSNTQVFSILKSAFNNTTGNVVSETKKQYEPIIPDTLSVECTICKSLVLEQEVHFVNDEKICHVCLDEHFETCASCDTATHYSNLSFYKENFHCNNCLQLHECKHCYTVHDKYSSIIEDSWCTVCIEHTDCSNCSETKHINNAVTIATLDPFNDAPINITLCNDCMELFTKCECGYLRDIETVSGPTEDHGYACESCISYNEDGSPFYCKKSILNT